MDTYEKKYKEALERAKKLQETCDSTAIVGWCEYIFPQLKESEDERIRKEMIFYFQEEIPQCSIQEHSDKMREFISWLKRQEIECIKLELKAGNSYFCYKSRWERADNETFKKGLIYKCNKDGVLDNFVIKNPEQHFIEIKDERIVWLEKQGTPNQVSIWKHWKDGICGNGEGKLIYLIKDGNNYRLSSCLGYECDYIELSELDNLMIEKQGEQKPADKVEPKFKVGDWVVNKFGDVWYIDSFDSKNYQVSNRDKYCYFPIEKQNEMHLWTIQDAKDGDVLFLDLMGGKTFIYNGINPDMAILYSFIISNDGEDVLPYHIGKPNTGIGYIEENKNIIHPATKEQRDLLFQKMKEAGYEWDSEKKELKKIEQNIEMVEALRTEYEKGRADAFAEMQKHNDAIKPKFNVGDYIVSNSGLKYYITGIFKGYYMTESGCIITLDAQDNYKVYNNFWSKEEEELLNNICNLLQNPDSIKANQHVIGNIVDWLKSIKDRVQPQNHWKPSDAQMRALEYIINNAHNTSYSCKIAKELLEQLKKLKG